MTKITGRSGGSTGWPPPSSLVHECVPRSVVRTSPMPNTSHSYFLSGRCSRGSTWLPKYCRPTHSPTAPSAWSVTAHPRPAFSPVWRMPARTLKYARRHPRKYDRRKLSSSSVHTTLWPVRAIRGLLREGRGGQRLVEDPPRQLLLLHAATALHPRLVVLVLHRQALRLRAQAQPPGQLLDHGLLGHLREVGVPRRAGVLDVLGLVGQDLLLAHV